LKIHNNPTEYEALESRIGYVFNDKSVLKTALTHSSFANEAKRRAACNERLEFLGDSVLSLCVSAYLFNEFPDLPEGDLTRLRAAVVSEAPLAEVARTLGIGEFLLLGRGEEVTGGRARASVLADAIEALIGAIYLDAGLEAARTFVIGQLSPVIQSAVKGKGFKDYKTELQELLQQGELQSLEYVIVNEEGPDHYKSFTAQVLKDGKVIGEGEGRSKKEAEQQAAHKALSIIRRGD
jgi:ribonuclease-3